MKKKPNSEFKRSALSLLLLLFVAIVHADLDSWKSYTFHEQDFYNNYNADGSSGGSRDSGCHEMSFNFKSKIGTTEIMFVGASNGNSTNTNKKTLLYGAGWSPVAYGGSDDKSAEIFMRQITESNVNKPGEVDARGAYANFSILVYPGLLKVGGTADKKLSKEKPNLTNKGSGPWLVLATTDNGKDNPVPGTKNANVEYYTKKDDRSWVYLTTDKTFNDNSAFNVRGAICSIELIPDGATSAASKILSTQDKLQLTQVGSEIHFVNSQNYHKVSIISHLGREILSLDISGKREVFLNSSALSRGSYLMKLKGKSSLVHKINIQ